jgi:hypothetical protein
MRSFLRLVLLVSVSTVWAAVSVEQTLDASGLSEINIENMRGQVSVSGDDVQQIRIRGTLDEVAQGLIFERRGSAAVVIVEMPDSRQLRGRKGSELEILIPKTLLVRFKGVSSNIDVKNTLAGVDLATVSGSIKVLQSQGDFKLDSVSGAILIADSEGRLTATNVSGDIVANLVAQELQASVISGNAKLTAEQLQQATVSSVSGDLELSFKVSESPRIKISSVTGEAVLQLLNPLNAKVRLQTGPGGDIRNQLNDNSVISSIVKEKILEFSVGNGAGTLRMNTVSGTLVIK